MAAGQKVAIECEGSTIFAQFDDVAVLTATDIALTAGMSWGFQLPITETVSGLDNVILTDK